MIKPQTIRIVLTLAITYGWPLRQLNVNNVFLNGILQKSVYISQPKGFVNSIHPNCVCNLNKSLYDIKQAHRAWFD